MPYDRCGEQFIIEERDEDHIFFFNRKGMEFKIQGKRDDSGLHTYYEKACEEVDVELATLHVSPWFEKAFWSLGKPTSLSAATLRKAPAKALIEPNPFSRGTKLLEQRLVHIGQSHQNQYTHPFTLNMFSSMLQNRVKS